MLSSFVNPRSMRGLLLVGLMCPLVAQSEPAPVTPPAPAPVAPAPVDPVKAKLEAEAQELYLQGDARMKVASYEEAINVFRNVLKRYPDTETRYKAQFRMADALVALKKEPEAITLLQAAVKELSPEWSPRALAQLGDTYGGEQKYSDAFRSYRQIITDYPDSPMVDRAYFAIGSTHFKLGHFELAAQELDKVGTAYASRIPSLQRVSPGEPLQVRIMEPNLVAGPDTTIQATVTARSGDRESVFLRPDVAGADRFRVAIPTQLAAPKSGDGILQLHGNDSVTLTYKARYVGGASTDKSVNITTASNARLAIRDAEGNEVRGVVVGDVMVVEVTDPDRDTSDAPDSVSVQITTKRKDSETLKLTETGDHTGIFRGEMKTAAGPPAAASGTIETNAALAEGSATQFDDNIVVTYMDELNLSPTDVGPHKVSMTELLFAATPGSVAPVQSSVAKADLEIKSLLYKGRSLSQIAATYRDLGQEAKGAITFRKSQEQFQDIITRYPNAPEVEDALYGLFEGYVGQDQYDSAIAIITQITQKFPQSSRASQALFNLAALHVKREEYDRALGMYENLIQRARGTALAEEAQYAIATTYILMLKPKAGSTEIPTVTREQVTVALEEFARNYPQSERTPEALWQLVKFRYDGEDFKGAADAARRMVALYPDNVMTGRVLLLEGQAQYKLRDIDGARTTISTIIANYGAEADQAQKLLTELDKKYGSKPATTKS